MSEFVEPFESEEAVLEEAASLVNGAFDTFVDESAQFGLAVLGRYLVDRNKFISEIMESDPSS